MVADLHLHPPWTPPRVHLPDNSEPHFLDFQGDLLPSRELVDAFGETAALSAIIDYTGSRLYGGPAARGYPPRIFVSYRRESRSHVNWVLSLGRSLQRQGYNVLLDELAGVGPDNLEDIARHMAQLYYADAIIIVASEDYFYDRDRAGGMSVFVFEELQRIRDLSELGLVEVIVVVVSGSDEQLAEFGINPGRHAVFDFRYSLPQIDIVTEGIGGYVGPVLSAAEESSLAQSAHDVIATNLGRLNVKWDRATVFPYTDEPSYQEHCNLLENSTRLHNTHEFRIARISSEWSSGHKESAVALALEALSLNPPISLAADLAEWLWLLDADFAAFQECAQLADGPGRWVVDVHHIMGDILFRCGRYEDALNHFNFCVSWHERPALRGPFGPQSSSYAALNAARVARCWSLIGHSDRAGPFLKRAVDWSDHDAGVMELVALIATDKQHFIRQYAYWECCHCGAVFSKSNRLCGLCGCLSHSRLCEMCGLVAPPQLPESLGFCAICRRISNSNDRGTFRSQLVDRRVGGRWSFAAPGDVRWAGEPGAIWRGYNLARPELARTGHRMQRADPRRSVGQPFES